MTQPPTDRNQALRDALEPLLQNTGDAIADVFDQLTRGSWRDDHGHDVKLNAQMIALQDTLMDIASFRTKHFGYKDIDPRPAMQEPASEPAESDADWIWWGVVDGQNVVTFGRWPKHGSQRRYKLADIQPTEHDHKPASEPAPASAPSCCGWEEVTEAMCDAFWHDYQVVQTDVCKSTASALEAAIRARAQPCRCGELREAAEQTVAALSGRVHSRDAVSALARLSAATAPRSGES